MNNGSAVLNSWETMKQQKTTQISASFWKDMKMSERALNKLSTCCLRYKIQPFAGYEKRRRTAYPRHSKT